MYVIHFHLPADGNCTVNKIPEIVTRPWRSNMRKYFTYPTYSFNLYSVFYFK